MSTNQDRAAAGAAGIRRSRHFPPVGRPASGRHRDPPRQERHGQHQEEDESMDYIDAEWRPGWRGRRRRRAPFAGLRRCWEKMTRAERRRTLRTLRESAVVLGCIVVAIGLPGWVEYIL